MKLSSRKELLKESELTLKSIKKSLNEAAVPQRDVQKVTKWMREVSMIFGSVAKKISSEDIEFISQYNEMESGSEDVYGDYVDILDSIKSIREAIKFIGNVRKIESRIPEIQRIVKMIEDDIKTWETE
jgi:hypothetical protein